MRFMRAIFRRSAIRFIARCFECRKFRQKSIQEMQEGRISGKIFLRSIIRGSSVMQQPASENETKALIRIFQEYTSCGLLSFDHFRNRILYFKQSKSFAANQKSYRLARHLQKCSSYYMENSGNSQGDFSVAGRPGTGSPEQFYAEICHKPSFRIETLEAEGRDQRRAAAKRISKDPYPSA